MYYYIYSPELAESYFIQWRTTKNPKYRMHAWELVQAIYKYCRIPEMGAYSTISDVDKTPTSKLGHQPSLFLSATLKYLYLTFSDDSTFPLDQWVFNSVGHPFPVAK